MTHDTTHHQPSSNGSNNGANDYKVIKVLQSEAARYAAILIFVVPIFGFIYSIKVDIELIKQNHIAHTERALEEIRELKLKDQEIEQEIIEVKKDQVDTDKQMLILLERLAK